MIDLHSHILPGLDDGAVSTDVSLEMARAYVAQGVTCVVCTPHILPGLYPNCGPQIRVATERLQAKLADAGIPLRLVPGADNHIRPDFVHRLRRGELLTIGGTRYVLVEPPHHIAPRYLEQIFFDIMAASYVPILTHPERLSWISKHYDRIRQMHARGVWMQITAGSLLGRFGRSARYWAEKMLGEGLVRVLATDAHDARRRPPDLEKARLAVENSAGSQIASHLVDIHPIIVLSNASIKGCVLCWDQGAVENLREHQSHVAIRDARSDGGVVERVRQFFQHRP